MKIRMRYTNANCTPADFSLDSILIVLDSKYPSIIW
jgi:hypothetical protein